MNTNNMRWYFTFIKSSKYCNRFHVIEETFFKARALAFNRFDGEIYAQFGLASDAHIEENKLREVEWDFENKRPL